MVDAPRFAWRGVLLDVGRHFFPVPFILKVLDVCAFYKITRFHWHLTEDQARLAPRGRACTQGLAAKVPVVAMVTQGIIAPAEARSLFARSYKMLLGLTCVPGFSSGDCPAAIALAVLPSADC